jgi:hypothetical protein
VCAELSQLQPGHPLNLTLADILATHELKSFDYRVSLHRMGGRAGGYDVWIGGWIPSGRVGFWGHSEFAGE